MEKLFAFTKRFGIQIDINRKSVIRKGEQYFLIKNSSLRSYIQEDFIFAGTYLGEMKQEEFFPSFILLEMMGKKAKKSKGNYVKVNKKSEWLFICGRDLFQRGIIDISGSRTKGDYTLVLNQLNECLGFGKILRNIDGDKERNKVLIRNVLDLGDFLRRERY